MAVTMKELGIDQLSVEDRLTLIQEIWDSIPDAAVPLSEDQKRLFDERLADLEARPDEVLTWEEIKADVRAQR